MPGGTYFFTVTLRDRDLRLLVDHVASLRTAFLAARVSRPFFVDAIVVLPEHLHCLMSLPDGDADFTTRWRHIKAEFSRTVDPGEFRSKSRKDRRERGIWQRRYWEHAVRDEADLMAHVEYIHHNPVKHGLVSKAIDWPHSSFRRYVHACSGASRPETAHRERQTNDVGFGNVEACDGAPRRTLRIPE